MKSAILFLSMFCLGLSACQTDAAAQQALALRAELSDVKAENARLEKKLAVQEGHANSPQDDASCRDEVAVTDAAKSVQSDPVQVQISVQGNPRAKEKASASRKSADEFYAKTMKRLQTCDAQCAQILRKVKPEILMKDAVISSVHECLSRCGAQGEK